jgi:hypothetical protein
MPLNPAATYAVTVSTTNSNASGSAVSIYHFTSTAARDTAVCNTFIGHLKTMYTAFTTLFVSTQTFQIGGIVRTMETPAGFIVPATPQNASGTGGGNILPPQLAMVVSWRTALAGRGYRGRNYIGPIASGVPAANGQISPAIVTTCQNAVNAFVANVNGMSPTSNLVVWSPTRSDGELTLSGIVRSKIGTLRSRN